jgi:hypothetical protein
MLPHYLHCSTKDEPDFNFVIRRLGCFEIPDDAAAAHKYINDVMTGNVKIVYSGRGVQRTRTLQGVVMRPEFVGLPGVLYSVSEDEKGESNYSVRKLPAMGK